jgi:hypothetical protein
VESQLTTRTKTRGGTDAAPEARSDRGKVGSRTEGLAPGTRPTFGGERQLDTRSAERRRDATTTSKAVYRERTDVVRDVQRYEHVYVDRHNQVQRSRTWPSFHLSLCYNWGPHYTFMPFYPYYHRRYVFVSIGGYWPMDYCYMRYYWYGCHPYYWYGYDPIAREIGGDTYNYYTYNYYNDDTATTGAYSSDSGYQVQPVDHTTFEDVRQKLAQQGPAPATFADKYFDDAVGAFELGDYARAAELFARAMEYEPNDMIMPFAYCQALFASGEYTKAAEALRAALGHVSPEKEGVFFPRGLYKDEKILMEQIDQLEAMGELYSFDGDIQLLLGYQLLGIRDLDGAAESLRLASLDTPNASSATLLGGLADKLKSEEALTNKQQ